MDASQPLPGQLWNTAAYDTNGRFVATLATAVVDLLALQPTERLLDIGCGDGALTDHLRSTGAHVTGIDPSPAMAAAARARGLDILEISATDLPFTQHFDAAFSNAALHWIPAPDQPRALAAVYRALRPGGRFVAEMGGQGNIASIRTALQAVCLPLGVDAEALARSVFPSPAQYQALLEAAGFHLHTIALHPRPTPLPGAADGLRRWLETFRNGVLGHLSLADRTLALSRIEHLLTPVLLDPGDTSRPPLWTADYVRLRFHATRPL